MANLRELWKRRAFVLHRAPLRGLTETEERIRVASEVAGLGTYEVDYLSNAVYFSPELCAIMGIPPGSEARADNLYSFIHPLDREKVQRLNERSRSSPTEDVVRAELRLLRPDGEVRWILWSSRTFFQQTGAGFTPVRSVGAAMDITAHKRGEESLRRSEERLWLAVRAANLGTWDWDLATNSVTASTRCKQLLGITSNTSINPDTFFSAVHPDSRVLVRSAVEVALAGGIDFHQEARGIWPDGIDHWLELRGRARYDDAGKAIRMTGIISDITEAKQAEQALRQSEEVFRTFFYNAGIGMAQMDVEGNFHAVNEHFCRSVGYTSDELLKQPKRLADLVHPEDRERYWIHYAELVSSEQHPAELEMRCVRKDSGVIWVHLTGVVIRDAEGKPVRYVKVIEDITERKMAVQALLRSEKLASVGRMAATMAHEFNNPLAAAINAVYLALADESLSRESREVLEIANKELARLVQIGKQSLIFYRELGRPTRVSMETVLDQVLDLYEPKLSNKVIQVVRRYHCTPTALAVEGELRHAISNLVANAFDSLPLGGTLTVSTLGPIIGKHERPMLRLTVADSGSGIGKEHLSHIFEPFFTTKPDFGTGLGLWVTHELIKKQGGDIRIRSQVGKGTAASIWLPIERREDERLVA